LKNPAGRLAFSKIKNSVLPQAQSCQVFDRHTGWIGIVFTDSLKLRGLAEFFNRIGSNQPFGSQDQPSPITAQRLAYSFCAIQHRPDADQSYEYRMANDPHCTSHLFAEPMFHLRSLTNMLPCNER
jgi:hypothetical protein